MTRNLKLIVIVSLGLSSLGCQRQAWEAGKQHRLENIDRTAGDFRSREAEALDRLDRTGAVIRESSANHQDHLQRTSTMVRAEWEGDKTRWLEERPKRRAFAREYFRGEPETIPATWAKLMY